MRKLSVKRRKEILDTFFPAYYTLDTSQFRLVDWRNLIEDEMARDTPRKSVLKILHRKYAGARRTSEWGRLKNLESGWHSAV